jgi:hypothetical protein
MGQYFGCWSWCEQGNSLVRDDGALLRYVGPAEDEPDPAGGHWFRFEIACGEGETPLLVQHRLVGFHGQYRILHWRADFTRVEAAGGKPPRSYRQWAAFERIAADGLACWPIASFGEIPDFVGTEGGWSGGEFRRDRFRLYERVRVERLLHQGRLPEVDSEEACWRFQPLDPSVSAPSRAELSGLRSAGALRRALAEMIDRGPALVCEHSAILLEEDEHGSLHATYVDEDFVSDRYMISGLYRTQEDRWGVGDYAIVQIGSRRLRDLRAAEQKPVEGLLALFWKKPKPHHGREDWPADPTLVERAGRSFAEALFHVPHGAFSERRVHAPPILVSQTRGWLQAGYLHGRLQVAHSLSTDEFEAAFADTPRHDMTAFPRPEIAFDPDALRLEGPSGATLVFERRLEASADGPAVLMRCRDGALDWPLVVDQERHRYLKLRTWRIDHDASLEIWRSETGLDAPEPDRWDCMRQFLEDAILSWPDTDPTGAAPQQLIASGGYYDGEWRRAELVRTAERPFHFDEFLREADVEDWTPYAAQVRWERSDDLPVGLAERNYGDMGYVYSRGEEEVPIAFAKRQVAGEDTLAASVYSVSYHREERHRTDYADYRNARGRLRVPGVRSAFALGSIWLLDEDAAPQGDWRPGKGIRPTLPTWRALRDAAESGLRPGEQVSVTGAWIFNRFFGGPKRTTALSRQAAVSA